MFRNLCLAALAAALFFVAPMFAQELPEDLAAKQKAARDKLGQAAFDYATFCAKGGAYAEARRWYGAAITIAGNDKQARAEFAKVAGKPDKVTATYKKESVDRLAKVRAAGADLFEFIKDARDKDADALIADDIALWYVFAWDDKLLKAAGWAWHEPLCMIAPAADIARYGKGELRLGGKWLTKDEVAALDKQHAGGEMAVVQSGWFEATSDCTLVRTLSTLNYAALWRVHAWSQFCAELELSKPAALPIYVCSTRAVYTAQVEKIYGQKVGDNPATAAYHHRGSSAVGPLTISLEAKASNGNVSPAGEPVYYMSLRHELTHQLIFEGLKALEQNAEQDCQLWVIEVFGTWAENWFLKPGRFEQRYFKAIPLGVAGKARASRIADAQTTKGNFHPFEQFAADTNQTFGGTAQVSYAQTALTGAYMLQGGDADLRKRFMVIAQQRHCSTASAKTFVDAFKGVNLGELDKKIRAYLDSLKLEDWKE